MLTLALLINTFFPLFLAKASSLKDGILPRLPNESCSFCPVLILQILFLLPRRRTLGQTLASNPKARQQPSLRPAVPQLELGASPWPGVGAEWDTAAGSPEILRHLSPLKIADSRCFVFFFFPVEFSFLLQELTQQENLC